jgi:cell division GTPase FtsZ
MFPGYSGIVQYGHRSFLAMALSFALLLNAFLIANFYWTALITTGQRNILLVVLFGTWVALMFFAAHWKRQLDAAEKLEQPDETLHRTICHYLRGDWFATESQILPHLEKHPEDIEMLLLQATMYRHAKRYEEAVLVLDKLRLLQNSQSWHAEIEAEQLLIAAAKNDGAHAIKETSEITEDVKSIECVEIAGKNNKQSTTSNEQPEIVDTPQQSKQQEETPGIKLTEELCCKAEMLVELGLGSQEIAQRLGISLEALDFLLQFYQNIDTITGTDSTSPSNMFVNEPDLDDSDGFVEAEDTLPTVPAKAITEDTTPKINSTPHTTMTGFDDFDGFVEADATRSALSPKAIHDNFKTKNAPAFKIGIVGVGQCGNNIAQAFHRMGYRRVLLVNTAQTDLNSIEDKIPKLLIDKQGAGKDPAIGKARVEAKATEIRNGILREFGEDFEKIIVCLGLGGGTGSGGGPAVVKIAKDIVKGRGGNPARDVIAIVTLPDPNMDGPRQCFNALAAYGQIANLDVPMIIIDNAQVGSIIRAKLTEGWTPINTWIVRTFHMFNMYANMPSDLGAFDGNDLNDVISRGRLLFSAFRVTSLKDRYAIGDTMATNLERSLFAKCDRATATAAGCLMVINPRIGNDLRMEDLAPAFQEINSIMRPDSTLHRGIYIPNWSPGDQDKHPDLFCYIIFGGLDHPRVTLAGLFEKAKNIDQQYGSVEAFLTAEA